MDKAQQYSCKVNFLTPPLAVGEVVDIRWPDGSTVPLRVVSVDNDDEAVLESADDA